MGDEQEKKSRQVRKNWIIIIGFLLMAALLVGATFGENAVVAQKVNGSLPEQQLNIWTMQRWSPYVVGILIGMLSWVSFLLSDKPLGVSTAYARTAGMVEEYFKGPSVRERPYYKQYVPKIGWEWMLVAGLVVGAFTSAILSGEFRLEVVPALWNETFGHTPFKRLLVALIGGIFMGLGARWADGCTSGHGISGTLQLVVSSWIALFCFFIGGVIAAFIIY